MGKEDNLIMVVKKDILFDKGYFEGFRHQNEIDYEQRILRSFEYMKRGSAEKDPNYKQPIGYAIIVNPHTRQVFAYQRSLSDKYYGEKRLMGKWSWGVGGHIEKVDQLTNNPLQASVLRELEEEIGLTNAMPKVLGYINDDSNDVGKVHFGILYVVETNMPLSFANAGEIATGELKDITFLEMVSSSSNYAIETWSQIALTPLKEYLKDKY